MSTDRQYFQMLSFERDCAAYRVTGSVRVFLQTWEECFGGNAPVSRFDSVELIVKAMKRTFAEYELACATMDEYANTSLKKDSVSVAGCSIGSSASPLRDVNGAAEIGDNSGRENSEPTGQVETQPAARPELRIVPACDHDWRGIDTGRMCYRCGLVQSL